MTELSEFFPAFQKIFGQDRKMTEKTTQRQASELACVIFAQISELYLRPTDIS